jgi:ATP-dependent Lon protease
MESGVRSLDRAIGAVCRQIAYNYVISTDPKNFIKVIVSDELIKEALGNSKYDFKMNEKITKPGIAIVSFVFVIFRLGSSIH